MSLKMGRVVAVAVAVWVAVVAGCSGAQAACDTAAPSTASNTGVTAGNALVGFLPYARGSGVGRYSFPHSMEYSYLALKDVVVGEGVYQWSVLDGLLADAAGRGNQLVFRLYLDYPDCCAAGGGYETAVPDYLLSPPSPVTFTPYSEYGGGQSPDYGNQRLVDAMTGAIAAMGARYDGDSRIAFIMVGLLGYWGEWHTYPNTAQMAPQATQLAVWQAYDSAFATTRVVVSSDQLDQWQASDPPPLIPSTSLGWHDDNFGVGTYSASNPQSWYTYDRMAARGIADRYLVAPMGGEVQPSVQPNIFRNSYSGHPFLPSAQSLRFSWLLYHWLFENPSADDGRGANALAAVTELGYRFVISNVDADPCSSPSPSPCLRLAVTVDSIGLAPSYYDLVVVASIDGESATSSFSLPAASTVPGSSPVVVGEIAWSGTVGSSVGVTLSLHSPHILPSQTIALAQLSGVPAAAAIAIAIAATAIAATAIAATAIAIAATAIATTWHPTHVATAIAIAIAAATIAIAIAATAIATTWHTTHIAPSNSPSPSPILDQPMWMYGAAGGGLLLCIVAVIAAVVIRRRRASSPSDFYHFGEAGGSDVRIIGSAPPPLALDTLASHPPSRPAPLPPQAKP
ncbi:CBM6-containing protein [Thecamonas trahens ATCC 50062]|uniref:CBM6-containing protein n=1 Tax=Thecamonas trahens ATCC 50062 TaxID=461836 RepID=A0A0L0DP24_THETB|nr:CBM6-containing protein [Thecamonas trahens ATCC 50062]KNC54057.1 CBM6-containing protein [Thecamonas trahens ATCC 50062]|eukprot:XP_013754068.1 CBM6-containing protein [Thecamonas trahens ATCC 50062]